MSRNGWSKGMVIFRVSDTARMRVLTSKRNAIWVDGKKEESKSKRRDQVDGIFGNDGGNRRTESMKSQLGRERQVWRAIY